MRCPAGSSLAGNNPPCFRILHLTFPLLPLHVPTPSLPPPFPSSPPQSTWTSLTPTVPLPSPPSSTLSPCSRSHTGWSSPTLPVLMRRRRRQRERERERAQQQQQGQSPRSELKGELEGRRGTSQLARPVLFSEMRLVSLLPLGALV